MLKIISIPFIYQYKFQDFKQYTYDFFIDNNYILEFDGKQHFVSYEKGWNNKENVLNTHNRDLKKNSYCFEHKIPIIRIPYDIDYNIDDIQLNKTRFLLTPDNKNNYYKERIRIC